MSGLIDTIVRRRRASASSRLGPPPEALERVPWTEEPPAPEPASKAPEPVDVPAPPEPAYDQPQPVPAHEYEADEEYEEYEDAPEPEYEPQLADEPEPAYEPELEPEPELEYEPEPAYEPDPDPYPEPDPPAPPRRTRTPQPPADAYRYPPLRERVALRRRARHLAAVREIQLRDLGGFLVELHRFGQRRPDLIQAKLEAAAATDAQWRDLHHQLDEEAPIGELRTPGIGGACSHCGAVHGSLDHFCASCGESLQ